MEKDTVIKVENMSKKFSFSLKRSLLYGSVDILKSMLGINYNTTKLRKGEFWALDDIDFTLKKGDALGIIGINGSGKSTLLRLLTGIYPPDKGSISIRGKVGSLIAVGAGFHPHMTGRENIYLNGTILGMTRREIDQKLNKIINFADIGNFLDAPVANYSSGMRVRLGFAIAINCDPDILLIDEILSVGDLSFRNKSLRYMAEYRNKASALIFVTHDIEQVRNLCNRVIILDKGKMLFDGSVDEGVVKYEELIRSSRLETLRREDPVEADSNYRARITSAEELDLLEIGVCNPQGEKIKEVGLNEELNIYCDFKLNKKVESLYFTCGAVSSDDYKPIIYLISNENHSNKFKDLAPGNYRIKVNIPKHHLIPNVYLINFAIRNEDTAELYEKIFTNSGFKVVGDNKTLERGYIKVESNWDLAPMV